MFGDQSVQTKTLSQSSKKQELDTTLPNLAFPSSYVSFCKVTVFKQLILLGSKVFTQMVNK